MNHGKVSRFIGPELSVLRPDIVCKVSTPGHSGQPRWTLEAKISINSYIIFCFQNVFSPLELCLHVLEIHGD
jgi:hypothetical protein